MNMQRQQGMTFISTLLLLLVGGFLAMLVLKLLPIYLDNYKIQSVLASLEAETGMGSKPVQEIKQAIDKRLYINEVRHIGMKDIKIKRQGNFLDVRIGYVVKEPIMGNVEVLVTFDNNVQLTKN